MLSENCLLGADVLQDYGKISGRSSALLGDTNLRDKELLTAADLAVGSSLTSTDERSQTAGLPGKKN